MRIHFQEDCFTNGDGGQCKERSGKVKEIACIEFNRSGGQAGAEGEGEGEGGVEGEGEREIGCSVCLSERTSERASMAMSVYLCVCACVWGMEHDVCGLFSNPRVVSSSQVSSSIMLQPKRLFGNTIHC